MLIVLTSLNTLGFPDTENTIVKALKDINAFSIPVAIVSNKEKPNWFDDLFQGSEVNFIQELGRQNGKIVSYNAEQNEVNPFDVIVIASNNTDVQMGKNGAALILGAGWSDDSYVRSLGIRTSNAVELKSIIELTKSWTGQWWYSGIGTTYNVKALSDLSTYGKSQEQADFRQSLTATVKGGGPKLNSLLAITARSLLKDGFGREKKLLWGVYPSANSANDDSEVLTDFTHRLRTTVSRVKYAKIDEPLFIRHKPSVKRSNGGVTNRDDPTNQIETLHLNPFYKRKINGRHVVVIDDCTTYGVSFAVAAAFLKKAGAKEVTAVALGKFGNQLLHRNITIHDDAFTPVKDFTVNSVAEFNSVTCRSTPYDLKSIIE